jgi:hypothetical protein
MDRGVTITDGIGPAAGCAVGAHSACATLTVTRNRADDVPSRLVSLSLDDEKVGSLPYGRAITREIAPGHHTLRANNSLCWKKIEFDAAPGEHVQFATVNCSGPGWCLALTLLGLTPLYLFVERQAASPIG